MKSERIKFIDVQTLFPVVIDFFCGAGGFTRGALDAGAHVVCGIDCDDKAKNTYEQNNINSDGTPVQFIHSRIEELEPVILKNLLSPFQNHPIVFVGCPPCQPFTKLGTDKSRSAISKESLSFYIDFVVAFLPRFVVVENVPGIRSEKNGVIWEESLTRLQDAGYFFRDEVVDAKSYGAPQTRRRTLLIAAYQNTPPWPAEKYSIGNYRKVKDILQNGIRLSKLKSGQRCSEDPLHVAAKLSDLNLRRIKAIKKPGGSRTVWSEDLQLECYKNITGYTDIYGRMDWNKPAPTLTTRFNSLSNGRFGHPEEDRAITPREGALLQTFPHDYKFSAPSINVNVRHIGNAVPPLLAGEIMTAIIKQIETCKNTDNSDGSF